RSLTNTRALSSASRRRRRCGAVSGISDTVPYPNSRAERSSERLRTDTQRLSRRVSPHTAEKSSDEREFNFLPERQERRFAAHQPEHADGIQTNRIRLPAPQPRQLDLLHNFPPEQHVCQR